MLSGQVPFAGDNSVSVALLHIQSEAIPVRELNPEVPLSVDKIIQKCMQKKPERRYQTAAELIVDLKRSVINPEGDYVSISSNAIVPNSPTRSITEEELNTIKSAASAAKTPSTRISYSDRKIRKKVKRETEELDTMDSGLEKVLTVVSVLAAIALLVLIFYLAWNLFVKDNGEGSNGGILSGLFNENNGSSTTPTPDQATPTEGLIKVPATPSPSPSPVPIGSELVEVPRVIGLTREDAEDSLKKKSPYFQITYVEEFNDEYAKDLICAQYPGEHSMVPEDKVIQLTLSVGPEMKELLDVKGRDSSSAKMLLENNDYKTEFIEEYDDVIEAGYVIRTEPEAGEMLPKGEVVRVYVSRGREIKYVECPDIVGRKQARAEKMITAANLVVGEIRQEYSDSFDKGIVISQDVAAGSQAEEGSMVSFVVSLGSEPVVTDPPVITQDPVVTPDPGITYTPWPTQDPGGEGGQPAG